MKKRFLVIIMMLMMLCLVGCVDADVTIDLKNDGTGNATVEIVGPNIVFDNVSENLVQQIGKDYDKVEKIKKDDKTGYKFTTKQAPVEQVLKDIVNLEMINPAAVQSDKTSTGSNTGVVDNATTAVKGIASDFANDVYKRYVNIKSEESFLFTTYDINVKLRDALYNNMTLEQKLLINLVGNSSKIGIHIKSPTEAEASNATNVTEEDGKYVYNWNYTLANVENISFEVKEPNIKHLAMIAGGVLLALIILISMLRAGRRRRKRRKTL